MVNDAWWDDRHFGEVGIDFAEELRKREAESKTEEEQQYERTMRIATSVLKTRMKWQDGPLNIKDALRGRE